MTVRRVLGTTATTGATVTPGGTPGGTPIGSGPALVGTGTAVWSTSNMPVGVTGKTIRMQSPTSTDTIIASYVAVAATPMAFQAYLFIASLSGVWDIAQWRTTGQNGVVRIDATRHLVLTNAAGTVLKTSTSVIPLSTVVRIEAWEDPDTTTTGQYTIAWFLEHDTAAQESMSPTAPGGNIGTTDITEVKWGKVSGAGTGDLYLWGPADNAGATGLIGPAYTNLPPTVSFASGAIQTVAAATTVNLSVTPTDTDGTVTTIATVGTRYTPGADPASITITGGSTSTPSYTSGAAGSLDVITTTVTDNAGATGVATCEVRVPIPAGTELLPLRGFAPIGVAVTNTGGATSEGAALADSLDATRIDYAAATSTAVERIYRLAPSVAFSSGSAVPRVSQDVAGTLISKLRFYQASTTDGSSRVQKGTDLTTSTTTSAADSTQTIDSTLASSVSDPGNLWVGFVESV